MFAPTQLLVVGFDGQHFTGAIAEELARLSEQGAIRVVDLLIVQKVAEDEVLIVEWLHADRVDGGSAGLILAFYRTADGFLKELDVLGERIRPDGMLWVAWPRKAAGHVSDLDENLIRDAALERGLVDVKVAAADTDWSALKLVWRRSNR